MRSSHALVRSRSSATGGAAPNRTTVTPASSAARWGSSSVSPSGTTAVPPGASACRISAFAAATASTVPSSSRWTGPIEVTQATSGGARAASSVIWPAPRMPISTTATWQPSASPIRNIGTPNSVLRLPGVPSTATPAARSMATRMSLVVVLPVAPVTPTTRAPLRSRAIRPAACSTASGSFVTSTGLRMACASPSIQRQADSDTTAATAPSRSASGACMPPSANSPRTPTNSAPACGSRESMNAPSISTSGLPTGMRHGTPHLSRLLTVSLMRTPRRGSHGPRRGRRRG